jgi:hypothetical protein
MVLVGNTHIIAGSAETIPAVLALLEKEGVETVGNPDLYVRTYTHFGIDEARELRERAGSRAVSGLRRVFVIATPGLTNDAQNALLKTLEEPSGDARFFFIVPSPEMLLQTLRSRTQQLVVTSLRKVDLVKVDVFLAAMPAKRLELLKPLLEKGDDERRDVGGIIAFLSSLERELDTHPESLRAVYRARKYLGDRGALVKPLLEQVALLVPVVS